MSWHDANCVECQQHAGDNFMNADITLNEIENAFDKLATNKAPGLDGIDNGMLKDSRHVLLPMLFTLFNKIMSTGVFPEQWCSAIIVPVFKNGDPNDPNSYRGISLLSCVGKMFNKIINDRLYKWADDNGKFYDIQTGFMKSKSTTDNMYVLQSLVRKYLNKKKGRFYSVFIDFSKAFDSVPHQNLFYSLLNGNLHGRIINLLRNMYSKLKSCVQVGNSLSEDFMCMVGTRQGCNLSPILFVLYLNEFIHMSQQENCQGIFVNESHPNVNMLLYADDVVIVGDQVNRVQKCLNLLEIYCRKWGLTVNMKKTKVMVFRNGGIIRRNEVFYFNKTKIDIVPYYKYLGTMFSSRLSWSPGQATLAGQSQKALHVLSQVNYECDFSFTSACNLFDKSVLPVLTYASEIWGPEANSSIENVHFKFCKRQLGVGFYTPHSAVLGECGREHIHVSCYVKCIKYWLKIISLPHSSLLRSCYEMEYNQSLLGKTNWASKVRDLLYSHGFQWIWDGQSVLDAHAFLTVFTERVKDCELQKWHSDLTNTPKLRTYCLFKASKEAESYLTINIPRRLKVCLARFRTGSHNFEIEKGRHNNILVENRLCKFCQERGIRVVEDEFHVLLECHMYDYLREMYIQELIPVINLHTFVSIVQLTNVHCINNVANFVSNVFKLRKSVL